MRDPLKVQVGGNHYKHFKIQPVEFLQVNKIPHIESAIIKYACRWREKGGIEDIKKIIHYAQLLIKIENGTSQNKRICANNKLNKKSISSNRKH